MIRSLFLLICLLPSLLLAQADNPFRTNRPDYPNYAAFSGVSWNDGKPSVMVEGTWGEFISINGVSAKEIISWCNKHVGPRDAEKRFREDLPVVLELLGHKVPLKTKVQFRVDGEVITQMVTMTEENRKLLKRNNHKPPVIKVTQNQQITIFENILVNRFAYFETNSAAWSEPLAALKKREHLSENELAFELNRIMALFIDGHASVSGSDNILARPAGKLPILIEPTNDRFVAFDAERKALINDQFPFLTEIDGIPLSMWIEGCTPFFPKGSPQYSIRHALRQIRHLNFCRQQLKLPLHPNVRLTLTNLARDQTYTLELPISKRMPGYGKWPRATAKDSHILDNNIGYLRLDSMNEEAERALAEWMPKFRDTSGLIIDVRDNGGGSRRALLDLASWLIEPNDPPHIANVAKYRRWKDFDSNHLEARFMARADDPRWSHADQRAITAFAKKFNPEWQPDPAKFSDWHYLLLTQSKEKRPFTYRKPVVILQNAKCFSATDIFLGALKGWKPNITLLGTSSGGGSARSIRHSITEQLQIRCASMASFQPNGKLYDGNGIIPDIIVHPEPSSFLHGSKDNQLKAAMELIKSDQD